MRELRQASIKDKDDNDIEFWFYDQPLVSDHIEIEAMIDKRGPGETVMALCVFMVLALNSEGKRLFPAVEFNDLASRLPLMELVRAGLQMKGIKEDADPKA